MNKKLFIILTILTVICVLLLAVGCDKQTAKLPDNDNESFSGDSGNNINSGDNTQDHIHTFDEEWTADKQYHWHASSCEHDLIADKAQHNFDLSGMCSICKYYTAYGFTFQFNSDNQDYTITGLEIDNDNTQLVIPSSYSGKPVTAIDNDAFKDCHNVTSVTIPSSITSIGQSAFAGCKGLIDITVEEQNATYKSDGNCLIEKENNRLVFGCKSSVIPSYVTCIGSAAFEGCKGLTSVEIPSSVEYIGYDAFRNCSDLTTVKIQPGLTYIYDGAFQNCINLKEINLPQGLADIRFQAFYGCKSLTSINIPVGTQNIGSGAFAFCNNLVSVN
ncbi:MAG: leucine-rich repeat domain-containing protein, partial [Clostridia bacterium]|nr:leucine-rich repeat domain-containing protein [Clostridia bacterium]